VDIEPMQFQAVRIVDRHRQLAHQAIADDRVRAQREPIAQLGIGDLLALNLTAEALVEVALQIARRIRQTPEGRDPGFARERGERFGVLRDGVAVNQSAAHAASAPSSAARIASIAFGAAAPSGPPPWAMSGRPPPPWPP